QRDRLRQAVTHHTHLFDFRMRRQAILDGRRRDVLAFAGLEDLLDPPGQAQVTLAVLLSLVAGAQEPVFGDGFGGQLRLLVIALGDGPAAHLHFTQFTDAHFHAGIVLADPAGFTAPRPTYVGITAVF